MFVQLKAALVELLEQAGAEKPRKCRFFRGQMQTIISRSLTDLDIAPVPSRRCFTLIGMCTTVLLTFAVKLQSNEICLQLCAELFTF